MTKVQIEPIVGRYMQVPINGRRHRLYWEEAGPAHGIPLLCLHTAGSDGRQFRALLNDADVTTRFRVITFDMPWHGKSSPPAGWQDEEYKLTTDDYVDLICTVADALELDQPVGDGLLNRRPHRARVGARAPRSIPRCHWPSIVCLRAKLF